MPSGKKPPSDPARAAKSILDQVTGAAPRTVPPKTIKPQAVKPQTVAPRTVQPRAVDLVAKNPAAVELGRRGGQARKNALSEEDRKRIASEAARKRWDKKTEG